MSGLDFKHLCSKIHLLSFCFGWDCAMSLIFVEEIWVNDSITKKKTTKQTDIKSIPNELYSETVQCSMPEFLKPPVSKAHTERQSA